MPSIINIAYDINKLLEEAELCDKIYLPHLLVLGEKGVGKSSLINKIMGHNILPINIKISVPINIHMFNSDNNYIDIGTYENEVWKSEYKITFDKSTDESIKSIHELIINFKEEKELHIKITSKNLADLSLIDLPPIENNNIYIYDKYLNQPKSIVLLVKEATENTEDCKYADYIKSKNNSLIYVFTKPDILDKENKHVFLDDETYFITYPSGDEKLYFTEHNIYSKSIYKNKCGVKNLVNKISDFLVYNIKNSLPFITSELKKIELEMKEELNNHNKLYPDEDSNKINILINTVNLINSKLIKSIDSDYYDLNSGYDIFLHLENLRKDIANYNLNIQEPEIETVLKAHKDFQLINNNYIIRIIKTLLNNYNIKNNIIKICQNNIKEISDKLYSNFEQIIKSNSSFDLLNNKILIIFDELLSEYCKKSLDIIIQVINSEFCYIWADNINIELEKNNDTTDCQKLKQCILLYFNNIKQNIKILTPKIIISSIIENLKENLFDFLINRLLNQSKELIIRDEKVLLKIEKINRITTTINSAYELLNKLNIS
jgi:GTP-binding protein EngB required for normal cell division